MDLQWSDKLDSTNFSQQVRRQSVHVFVASLQPDKIVPTQNLHVPSPRESILGAHELGVLPFQRSCEPVHPLQEYHDLICSPTLNVPSLRLEFGLLLFRRSRFPFRGQRVADVDEGGVEVGFGRKARRMEPSVPIYGFQSGGGARIG